MTLKPEQPVIVLVTATGAMVTGWCLWHEPWKPFFLGVFAGGALFAVLDYLVNKHT